MGDETRDERQDRDEKRRQEETVGGQTVRQTDRRRNWAKTTEVDVTILFSKLRLPTPSICIRALQAWAIGKQQFTFTTFTKKKTSNTTSRQGWPRKAQEIAEGNSISWQEQEKEEWQVGATCRLEGVGKWKARNHRSSNQPIVCWGNCTKECNNRTATRKFVVPPTRRNKSNFKMSKDDGSYNDLVLKGKMYTIAKLGSQVDVFAVTTKAIGEYMGKEFGHKMRMLVIHKKETTFTPPTLDENTTKQDEMKWSKDYNLYLKKKTQYNKEKAKVFAIILGQCDEPMKTKAEAWKICQDGTRKRCDHFVGSYLGHCFWFQWKTVSIPTGHNGIETISILSQTRGRNTGAILQSVQWDSGSNWVHVRQDCALKVGGKR
jgi:hypothetical protein